MLSCDKVTSRREATYVLGDRVAWILQPGSPYFLQIIKARSLAAFRSLIPSARPKARPLLETAKAPKKWFCCSLWSASSASVLSLLWLWIVRTAGPSITCRSLAIAAEFMVVAAARVKSVFLKMSLPPNVGREKTLSLPAGNSTRGYSLSIIAATIALALSEFHSASPSRRATSLPSRSSSTVMGRPITAISRARACLGS